MGAVNNKEHFLYSSISNICNICQKPSSSMHYGVRICEADKQFLKRTFHYQLQYPPCTKEWEGVCPPRPRGWCQLCRLRTCLSTPINISLIRIGEKNAVGSRRKKAAKSKVMEPVPFMFQMTLQPPSDDINTCPPYILPDLGQYPIADCSPTTFYNMSSMYRSQSPVIHEDQSFNIP